MTSGQQCGATYVIVDVITEIKSKKTIITKACSRSSYNKIGLVRIAKITRKNYFQPPQIRKNIAKVGDIGYHKEHIKPRMKCEQFPKATKKPFLIFSLSMLCNPFRISHCLLRATHKKRLENLHIVTTFPPTPKAHSHHTSNTKIITIITTTTMVLLLYYNQQPWKAMVSIVHNLEGFQMT